MKLYLVMDDVEDSVFDTANLLFVGKNWDFYFADKPEKNDFSGIDGVVFSKEYPEGMDDRGFLDYDRDQKAFLLLEEHIPADFPKEKIFREYKQGFFDN